MTADHGPAGETNWQPPIKENPLAEHRLRQLWEDYGDEEKFIYENTYIWLPETREMWQATADAVPALQPGALVVDMGIGPGFMTTEILKKSPGVKITGLDISINFLKQAQNKLSQVPEARENVELIQHDITQPWPIDSASVDAVVSNWVTQYHDADEQQRIFSEVARVLKPGCPFVMNSMVNKIPFGAVVSGIIAKANAAGLQENVANYIKNVPIAQKFGEAAQKGWAFNPTIEELENMHKKAGLKDFQVITRFVTEQEIPYLVVVRSLR